jgi:RNA recognition motif-containing protein
LEIRVKIYVGNLSFQTTESELRDLFGEHGEVGGVSLINDRETGRPRGFGFVEMPTSMPPARPSVPSRAGSLADAPSR